jgi:hypothetical protein
MTNPPSKLTKLSLACVGLGFLSVLAVNARLNHDARAGCSVRLSQLGLVQTGVGDSYKCVSNAQMMGPPVPLKD